MGDDLVGTRLKLKSDYILFSSAGSKTSEATPTQFEAASLAFI